LRAGGQGQTDPILAFRLFAKVTQSKVLKDVTIRSKVTKRAQLAVSVSILSSGQHNTAVDSPLFLNRVLLTHLTKMAFGTFVAYLVTFAASLQVSIAFHIQLQL
jgi:hypothetical protein